MSKEEEIVAMGVVEEASQPTSKTTSVEEKSPVTGKKDGRRMKMKMWYRRVYRYLEFTRGYKFTLFFLFGGALFAFSIQRLSFLDFDNRMCPEVPSIVGKTALPDLCYWVTNFTRYKVGILLHISGVLPACIFGILQFVPLIRHKFLLYHRITGYIVFLLLTCSNVGYLMIADIAEGGDLPTRTFLGFLALVLTIMMGLSIYNIKMLQIDQHRNWNLRIFIYTGFVISQRLLQVIIPLVLTTWMSIDRQPQMPCAEILWLYQGNTSMLAANFPACMPENIAKFSSNGYVLVSPKLGPEVSETDRARDAAAFNVAFSTAGFLALVLHAIVAELYIVLTPRTAEDLRAVSYRKQMERGWDNAGSRGLVAERVGDSYPWELKDRNV